MADGADVDRGRSASSTDVAIGADTADASNICIDCGMCCDGTLFSEASVRPYDDAELLTRRGLTIRSQGEELVIDLPCTEFVAGRCGIYDWRPDACRTYRCQLMRRVEESEIGAAEAREIIAETLVLRDRVRDGLHDVVAPGSPTPISEMRRRLRGIVDVSVDSGAHAGDHTALLQEADALGLLLSRHFHNDTNDDRTANGNDVSDQPVPRRSPGAVE